MIHARKQSLQPVHEASELDELSAAFLSWRLRQQQVAALQAEGWSNPAYAESLLREKADYVRLIALLKNARTRCLPA
jgi:hypothetical protein